MKKQSSIATASFMLLTVLAGQLQAAVVVYSGSDGAAGSASPRPNSNAAAAAFSAAASSLGPITTIDFESAPVGSFHNYAVAPGVSINGVSFSSVDQTIANAPFSPPDELFGYNTTAGGAKFVLVNGGTLDFTFSPAIQSFGAYFSGIQISIETITFSDGTTQTIFLPLPSPTNGGIAFVGFTDSGAQITGLSINVLGDLVAIDDVRIGLASEVPEPTSLTLLSTAMAALLYLARLKMGVPSTHKRPVFKAFVGRPWAH